MIENNHFLTPSTASFLVFDYGPFVGSAHMSCFLQVSARERVDAGLPTAMACSSAASHVAVGTSHGFILVFDGQQKLRFSLGGSVFGREHGSVSCLVRNFSYSPFYLDLG